VYARTKLAGERLVLGAYPDALVIRTTMFGWTLPQRRPKLAEEILASLTSGRGMGLWTDSFFSPMHVTDLADAILVLTRTGTTGIVNLGAREPVSRYDFGKFIAEEFRLNNNCLVPAQYNKLLTHNPQNTGLDVTLVTELAGWLPSVRAGVKLLRSDVEDGTAKQLRGRTTFP
jgi:dTDP-4-dehydrorhamnose reductase